MTATKLLHQKPKIHKGKNVSSDFASVYQSSFQQLPVTSKSVLTDSGKKENGKKIQRGLNWNTIQLLENCNENVENKEKCRFTEIEVEKSFVITLDEWKKMIENRTEDHFKNSFYKDVILEKLRTLYRGCVTCISKHHLRKKSAVLKLTSDMRFYEVYVNVYCRLVHFCHCAVTGEIDLFTFVGRVEGNVNLFGKRSHFIECVKSRHITGKQRELVAEKLQFMKPHSLFRSMQSF